MRKRTVIGMICGIRHGYAVAKECSHMIITAGTLNNAKVIRIEPL